MAATIGEFMHEFWDTSTCGVGIWWDEERTYKNAVTNGQWVRLTAELRNRLPGDTVWLDRAQEAWDWYAASGTINEDGLVNDGLTDSCANNDSTVWSYNQGLGIGGAVELYRATGDPVGSTCDDNQKQFKGIFMRYFMELADTTGESRYQEFVTRQAETVWENDRDSSERLGLRWAGGSSADSPNVFDWRTQASALSALIADVPQETPRHSLSAMMSPTQLVVRPVRARVRAQSPDGWQVKPAKSRVTLRPAGDGNPARATVALDHPGHRPGRGHRRLRRGHDAGGGLALGRRRVRPEPAGEQVRGRHQPVRLQAAVPRRGHFGRGDPDRRQPVRGRGGARRRELDHGADRGRAGPGQLQQGRPHSRPDAAPRAGEGGLHPGDRRLHPGRLGRRGPPRLSELRDELSW